MDNIERRSGRRLISTMPKATSNTTKATIPQKGRFRTAMIIPNATTRAI